MGKIPKHAKHVFNGETFDVFQWKQKMFNGKFKIFEEAIQLSGICMIATVKDKIVLLHQKQPNTTWYYTMPGGYLDVPGENPKQGALRELREETGLKPKSLKLWKKVVRQGRLHSNYYIYLAQNCVKIGDQDLDGGEIIEMRFLTFEQFLKLPDEPKFHNHDLAIEILRARQSPKSKVEFRKLIFGN